MRRRPVAHWAKTCSGDELHEDLIDLAISLTTTLLLEPVNDIPNYDDTARDDRTCGRGGTGCRKHCSATAIAAASKGRNLDGFEVHLLRHNLAVCVVDLCRPRYDNAGLQEKQEGGA